MYDALGFKQADEDVETNVLNQYPASRSAEAILKASEAELKSVIGDDEGTNDDE